MGRSKAHASSVGLIRNIETGSITSQFHVVYDDRFSTVKSGWMDQDQKIKIEIWKKLFQGSREHLLENEQDEPLPELSDEWLTDEEKKNKRRRLNKEKTRIKSSLY